MQLLRSPNAAYRWGVAGAAALLAAVLYLPPLRSVFRFAPLHAADLGIAVGAGVMTFSLLVTIKRRHS